MANHGCHFQQEEAATNNKELTDYVEKLGNIYPSILTLLLCSIPLIPHLVLLRTKNDISKRNI